MPRKCLNLRGLLPLAPLVVVLISPLPLGPQVGLHRVWAVKDARIVTLSGPSVEKGVLVIRDGLIEGVGPNVPIPPDAEIIDGSKLTVFPGLIDGLGQSLLKFPEEKLDMTRIYSGDFSDKDRGITPEVKAFDHVNLGKAVFEKYHKLGFTAAHVMPERGIFTGQSAFFCFSDPDKNRALLLRDACLGIGFIPASFLVYPNSLMGVNAFLKQMLSDAADFELSQARWLREMRGLARPDYSAHLENLAVYATGKKPVIFLCRNQHDIRRALALAAEFKLNFLIGDLGGEASEVIPEIQKARARVLCAVSFKAPGTSIYAQKGKDERERAEKDIFPKNPARLAAAAIPFAFSSLGTDDPKSFAEGVQKAIEAGLAKETALEALTKTPAAFFGLERALGTIEPGKIANVVLAEGDLLAKDSKVRYVFADGVRFELKEVKPGEGEKPAVNVSGKWELSVEGQLGMKLTLELAQDEASLSGRLVTPFGAFDFTGGVVSGSDVSFEIALSIGGQAIDLFISGTVTGDTMRGTVVQGTADSAEFTAKRIPG